MLPKESEDMPKKEIPNLLPDECELRIPKEVFRIARDKLLLEAGTADSPYSCRTSLNLLNQNHQSGKIKNRIITRKIVFFRFGCRTSGSSSFRKISPSCRTSGASSFRTKKKAGYMAPRQPSKKLTRFFLKI